MYHTQCPALYVANDITDTTQMDNLFSERTRSATHPLYVYIEYPTNKNPCSWTWASGVTALAVWQPGMRGACKPANAILYVRRILQGHKLVNSRTW